MLRFLFFLFFLSRVLYAQSPIAPTEPKVAEPTVSTPTVASPKSAEQKPVAATAPVKQESQTSIQKIPQKIDPTYNKDFFNAIYDGKYSKVLSMINQGANVNQKEPKNDETPLHWASYGGNLNIVKLLIQSGANVEAQTKDQFTPLHLASQQGNLDVVDYLLAHKANIEEKNSQQFTPLHLAAFYGHLNVVDDLLNKGAAIDSHAIDNATPLQLAAQSGKAGVVYYLIERGAQVNALASNRGSALHFAVHGNHPNIVSILLQNHALVNQVNDTNATAFVWNGYIGNSRIAEILLKYGADPKIVTVKKYTALHAAAIRGNSDLISYLLSHNIYSGKELSDVGCMAIHYAAFYGHQDALIALSVNSGGIDAKAKNGRSPLFYAIEGGQKSLVEYMVDKLKVSLTLKDNEGETPLEFAKRLKKEDMVVFLQSKMLPTNNTVVNQKDSQEKIPSIPPPEAAS